MNPNIDILLKNPMPSRLVNYNWVDEFSFEARTPYQFYRFSSEIKIKMSKIYTAFQSFFASIQCYIAEFCMV